MKIDKDIFNELRKYDELYRDLTEEDLKEGYRLSLKASEMDNPDDEMDYNDLFKLSSYYAYEAILQSDLVDYKEDDDFADEFMDEFGGDSYDDAYYSDDDYY
jgi:hypothetical protein